MVTATETPPTAPAAEPVPPNQPLQIRLPADWPVTDAIFDELFNLNPGLRFEIDEQGALIIMGFPGWAGSCRSTNVAVQVANWADAAGGQTAGADAEIRTGTLGRRLPAAAWLSPERAAQLPPDYEGPLPFCPDFVVEMVSPSDRRSQQEAKMRVWIEHGVRLAWLIDPFANLADIYREDGSHEQLERPATLSGEDVMPGLTVDLSQIWRAAD